MPVKTGAPHSGAALLRRTSVLPQAKPWRRGNSFAPSSLKFPGIQKETPADRLVFLFGGDTQTRTGGGAFAELCLTTWLCRHMDNRSNFLLLLSFAGAGDEARTRYLHLGKVALYQMSYTCRSQSMLCGCSAFDAGGEEGSLRRIPEVSSGEMLVPPAGIEPATRGFSVPCSTN